MSSIADTASVLGPFALEEVQAAVRALRAGQFKNARPTWRPQDGTRTEPVLLGVDDARATQAAPAPREVRGGSPEWTPAPGERVLAVIGSTGSCGASTVALAVALAAQIPARVLECCSASASGLAAASIAELGLHRSGWRHGRRDQVLIERASGVFAGVDEVPSPTEFSTAAQDGDNAVITVLDIGWEIGQLMATDCWVRDAVARADQVLVVAPATMPGIRRLEGTLELLAEHVAASPDQTCVAVLGPRRKKWPRGLQHAGGPHARRALGNGALVEIPEDRELAISGLDSRPLPRQLLSAASRVHDHVVLVDHQDEHRGEHRQIEGT